MKNIRTLLKVAGGGILLSWLTSSCAGLGVDLDYDDGYYYPYWSPGYNGVIYPPAYVPDIMYPVAFLQTFTSGAAIIGTS